jgi:hypothetical protein
VGSEPLPVWRGGEMQAGEIMFHSRGDRLHQSTAGPFISNVIAMDAVQLEHYGRALSGRPFSLAPEGQTLKPAQRLTARLRRPIGASRTVHSQTIDVPTSAKRFDELKVGDKVSITYNNTVSARLKPPGEPAVNTATTTSTAGQGERPGGTAAAERTMTATISGIDKSASSVTFTGPNGWKYSRRVADPTVL